jgi:hypothetical protein
MKIERFTGDEFTKREVNAIDIHGVIETLEHVENWCKMKRETVRESTYILKDDLTSDFQCVNTRQWIVDDQGDVFWHKYILIMRWFLCS